MGTYCDKCGKKTEGILEFSSYIKNINSDLLDYDIDLCKPCSKKLAEHMKEFFGETKPREKKLHSIRQVGMPKLLFPQLCRPGYYGSTKKNVPPQNKQKLESKGELGGNK